MDSCFPKDICVKGMQKLGENLNMAYEFHFPTQWLVPSYLFQCFSNSNFLWSWVHCLTIAPLSLVLVEFQNSVPNAFQKYYMSLRANCLCLTENQSIIFCIWFSYNFICFILHQKAMKDLISLFCYFIWGPSFPLFCPTW